MSAVVLGVEWAVGGVPDPGLRRFRVACERAGAEVANVEQHVLPKLVPVLERATGQQFDARGAGPDAGSWAPLSISYAKWKAAHYPGKPLLERTGALREGLTQSGSANARRDIGSNELTFGTRSVPYASAHQTGTERMPARPLFDFGPDFEKALELALTEGVREAVRAGSDGLLDFEGSTFEGLPVLTGRRGGRYVIGSNQRRVYLRQTRSGEVVQRRYGDAP
ncbi:MAG: phage virion morphogenesis protein [Archangium sp.]|nr:phage virion morphogenesis protein [Archangium sp.]